MPYSQPVEVSIGYYIQSYRFRWRFRELARLAVGVALVLMLSECQSFNLKPPGSWKTYHNQRYGFEFLYPSNWVAAPMPENRDGQAFTDPLQPDVEILGAAGYSLPEIEAALLKQRHKNHSKVSKQNFTTQQGLTGELQVEVGLDFSSMTLILTQGDVIYSWQGRSPSKQFANYYRFFYYVARQYRLSLSSKN